MAPLSLPWTKSPLIINAPMGGFAGPDLAAAVSKAGGLGQMGAVNDYPQLESWLTRADKLLARTADGLLPIGVGILSFMTIADIDEVISILAKFKPAVVWFFAAKENDDYATWATRVRKEIPGAQVWIQVGSVEVALEVAEKAKPDVFSIQGADAGGHGYEKGAGIISLFPEVSDALTKAGYKIPLVAAGGIIDGRGAAAAFALGAEGAVLGTRFLSACETSIHKVYQQAVIAASDGGVSTTRSKLFDNLRGPNPWPVAYDGRSIVMESLVDHKNGVDIEEIRKLHNAAIETEGAGFGVDGQGRAAMWMGTGVGLVKKVQPAAEIVDEVRRGVGMVLEGVKAKL